jgi:hypothetical protein
MVFEKNSLPFLAPVGAEIRPTATQRERGTEGYSFKDYYRAEEVPIIIYRLLLFEGLR